MMQTIATNSEEEQHLLVPIRLESRELKNFVDHELAIRYANASFGQRIFRKDRWHDSARAVSQILTVSLKYTNMAQ